MVAISFVHTVLFLIQRGKERSRLKEEILDEVKELKRQWISGNHFAGSNVNSYGKDFHNDYDFASLLEDVAKTGIPRIRFTTSHPWDFSDAMIDVIARYDNIMPAIHLPVQSGNSEVLNVWEEDIQEKIISLCLIKSRQRFLIVR